jgi:hypothetical protein
VSKLFSRHLALAWFFGMLTLLTVLVGGYALIRESDLVLVFALTPLFGVLTLAFGISARR